MFEAPTTQSTPVIDNIGRTVSIDEAALLLDVSRRTIYYRIRDGRLKTVRTLGGSQRVLLQSLTASITPIAQWRPVQAFTPLSIAVR